MRKIEFFEPYIFIFFGVFHIHRIWALFDRYGYASFWLGVMENKNVLYFLLMVVLTLLCVLGIITFLKNINNNYWWRIIYVLCGGYLLFDLLMIFMGVGFWNKIILKMYDVSSSYWNVLWGIFIAMGGVSLLFGIKLLNKRTD